MSRLWATEAEAFVFGANVPWFDYGLDFGASAWTSAGGVGRPTSRARLTREFASLAESGVQVLRWFLLCDGRAGIRFDRNAAPAGLDDFVFRDMDAALGLAQEAGLQVMFVLMDFHWCLPARTVANVQAGGRGALLRNKPARTRLLDVVIRPVLERYGRDSSVFAWDLFNEPEWVDDAGLRAFLGEGVTLARSCCRQPVTIGSAGAQWRDRYRDLGVDFYQVHWYDPLDAHVELGASIESLGFDRPVILGEFPTRGSRRSPQEILETARLAGYAGAFYWSALSQDECSDPSRRPLCKAGSFSQPPSSAKLSLL
jgi:hypothetical protein